MPCLLFQLVEPLQGEAWDEAVATIGKLTEKAAALAAHQQALSDYESLLFRWEEKLNPEVWEEAEVEEEESGEEDEGSSDEEDADGGIEAVAEDDEPESSSWFSGYSGGDDDDDEVAEGGDDSASDDAAADNDLGDASGDVDAATATPADVEQAEPSAELTEEEKAAMEEAAAAAAKAVEEQKVLVSSGREWLEANSASASTEELLAQLQDLDVALSELEPEGEPEEVRPSSCLLHTRRAACVY